MMTIEEDFEIHENEMAKADRLQAQLEKALGNGRDVLSLYRQYLDRKGIRAELDGWPSPEAHSQFNIRKFLQEQTN
jgi:hypothetical protein